MTEYCEPPPPHPSPAGGGGSRPSSPPALRGMRPNSCMIGPLACTPCARAQAPHHDRNEREDAERGERADELRRERRFDVKLEAAIGAPRRQARSVCGLLRGDHAVEARTDEGKYEGRR